MKIISILYFNNCVLVLLGPSFLENVVTLYSCLVSILCPYSCLVLIYHQNSSFIYCPSIPPEIRACSLLLSIPLWNIWNFGYSPPMISFVPSIFLLSTSLSCYIASIPPLHWLVTLFQHPLHSWWIFPDTIFPKLLQNETFWPIGLHDHLIRIYKNAFQSWHI